MGFSRKQNQSTGNSASKEKWDEWKKHMHEQHPAKKSVKAGKGGKKDRKQKVCPIVLNYIQDLGTPPPPPNKWNIDPSKNKKMEGHQPPTNEDGSINYSDSAYSEWETEFLRENKEADFIWDNEWNPTGGTSGKGAMEKVRKQTSPAQPAQEYGLCVDVPSWLVNFKFHPNAPEDAEDDWRPMRVSLNGRYNQDIQSVITFETDFRTKEVRENNIIRKICIAAGLDEKLREEDWDIGVAARAVCNMKITSDLVEDGEYVNHNTAASLPSAIEDMYNPMDEDQLIASASSIIEKTLETETLAPFTGVLLDMDMSAYTDELMEMVHSTGNAHAFIKRAEMSQEVLIEGTSKAGKEYSFTKGVDYDSTNFAKAYNTWLKKKDKEISKGEVKGNSGNSKPAESKPAKVETKPEKVETPEPSYNEPPMEFDDQIPF